MKKLTMIKRAAALLLCSVLLCVPLLGLAAPAAEAGTVGSSVSGNGAEAMHNMKKCTCETKCEKGAVNRDCPVCCRDSAKCEGKEPEPAPVCSCEVKCTDAAKNEACPVCVADISKCGGKEPEPAPVCSCEVKCTDAAKNEACPVCVTDLSKCGGKEPEPAPVCSCEVKCTDAAKNEACPVCVADLSKCGGKEPEPAPVCSCTVKCEPGAVKTDCPVCKLDLTGCKGKAAEPTPAPVPPYGISILSPSGWYTRTANVEIRVTDEGGTGWKTVEAKIERGGSWIDLTDDMADRNRATVEITENCTVYVTVTDKGGKAHTKSRYIECFDRTAPTIKAGIDGKLLRVEASDDLSGIDAIYIDGDRYDDLTNGTLDVRLRDLDDDYKQISVQAVDYAGNKSKTVQLNNPNYTDPDTKKTDGKKDTATNGPDTSKTDTTPAPTPTPTPPATTTTPDTGTSGGASASTGKQNGGTSSGTTGKTDGAGASSSQPVEQKPLTPDGQATVIDDVTDEDGKEFYTIVTPAENTFYLVIDKQRDSDNVYFLNAVTESDLLALAEQEDDEGSAPGTAEPLPEKCTCTEKCEAGAVNVKCPVCKLDLTGCVVKQPDAPATDAEPEKTAPAKNNTGAIVIVVLVVLAAGGAGYYFKVVKPKKDLDDADDFEDIEFEDDPDDGEPDELPEPEDYEPDGGRLPDEAPGDDGDPDDEDTEGGA